MNVRDEVVRYTGDLVGKNETKIIHDYASKFPFSLDRNPR